MSAYQGPEGQEDMPYLLTPGPITTSRSVKIAMLADYGSRDPEFTNLVRHVRNALLQTGGCSDAFDCVLMQGAGTFAMEAAIGTLCPARRKKTLVICNGAYGERAVQILERVGRPFVRLAYRETSMPRASDVAKTLDEDKSISHVWMAHCETSTGMLNPLKDIAQVVKARGRVMMADAMSTFGGVEINMVEDGIDVLVASSNKCLEGVPGIAFVLVQRHLLEASAGECHSLALDLHAQWTTMQATGQFRFTPPTHVLVALRQALNEFMEEGGIAGRSQRYKRNADTLRERLKAMGFTLLLADVDASPIIQTVLAPRAATFDFLRFYKGLHERGFAIYPGQLTNRPSFRIGCIGKLDEKTMQQVTIAIEDVMNSMDVPSFAPGDA